jgi:divalent metal cation (Fe/Co/Zn/Cd) transporter
MRAGRLAGLAAGAIVVLWGGVLVIAAIERRLPEAQQWYGHAAVHLWTVAGAFTIALMGYRALRGHRVRSGTLRRLVAAIVAIAAVVTLASALDAIGAYPTLRAFDRVNAVAAPAGWVLLAGLITLVVVASATELGRRRAPDTPPGAVSQD